MTTFFVLFLIGAPTLGALAWWLGSRTRPSDDIAPHADLPSLSERSARSRRFESAMDRSRGVRR